MRIRRILAAALAVGSLAGCASIVEGTTQVITVDVVPPTGTCIVTREGEQLGISTPEKRAVTVSKSKNNLSFDCSAPGYQPKTQVLSSDLAAATVASFFLLDLGIVDAATGAWKKYPSNVTVVLTQMPPAAPEPASKRKKS